MYGIKNDLGQRSAAGAPTGVAGAITLQAERRSFRRQMEGRSFNWDQIWGSNSHSIREGPEKSK